MSDDGAPPHGAPLLGGRYRLLARVGAGPTGTVRRARDERDGGLVAVKEPRLPGGPADGEAGRTAHRLAREADAAARVRHPPAVRVLDVAEEDGLPWIVMEWVEEPEPEPVPEPARTVVTPAPVVRRTPLAALGLLLSKKPGAE